MKKLVSLIALAVVLIQGSAFAYDVKVKGYTKSNGTYVSGYHRSSPNSSVYDNYGYND